MSRVSSTGVFSIISAIALVVYCAICALPAEAIESDADKGSDSQECVADSKNGKVSCSNPHAACSESEVVIDTLKKIAAAYTSGDFVEFEKYLDDGVTTFDKRSKKLLVGREAVMTELKKRWHESHIGKDPVVSYKIEHPYARVDGDTAVVTFHATKVIGGEKHGTFESECTDVFVRKDGSWKKLHYKSDWKKIKS
ncbi:MAG: nuclear transport factor 2 family protein [Candidatus Obscuribacterales bacterium]|nr:nuclear transport factor 2 family protein [Candidatus Obscuribacterales bacterium]